MEYFLQEASLVGIVALMVVNALANQLTLAANNPELKATINNNPLYNWIGALGTIAGFIWLPIYVGAYLGWVWGVGSLFLLNMVCFIIGKVIYKLKLINFALNILAIPLILAGYYLTVSTYP